MARNRKQFGARVVGTAKTREPSRAAPQDRRHNGDGFDVVHRGWAAIKASPRRERWLHARHTLAPLEAFQQRGFFAANIRPGAVAEENVEIPARLGGVLADQTGFISLVNRSLQGFTLANILAANVDVAGVGVHRERRDQTPFDQRMRIVAHDFAVLAGAGLGFVSVDNQIRRATVAFLGHERPFQASRETRTTPATQARGLHLGHDPVAAFADDILGAVPRPARHRALEAAVIHPVDVREDPVLILQHRSILRIGALAVPA